MSILDEVLRTLGFLGTIWALAFMAAIPFHLGWLVVEVLLLKRRRQK